MPGAMLATVAVPADNVTEPKIICDPVCAVFAQVVPVPQLLTVGWLLTVRLSTGVVLVTDNGAVPVATVEMSCPLVLIPPVALMANPVGSLLEMTAVASVLELFDIFAADPPPTVALARLN